MPTSTTDPIIWNIAQRVHVELSAEETIKTLGGYKRRSYERRDALIHGLRLRFHWLPAAERWALQAYDSRALISETLNDGEQGVQKWSDLYAHVHTSGPLADLIASVTPTERPTL